MNRNGLGVMIQGLTAIVNHRPRHQTFCYKSKSWAFRPQVPRVAKHFTSLAREQQHANQPPNMPVCSMDNFYPQLKLRGVGAHHERTQHGRTSNMFQSACESAQLHRCSYFADASYLAELGPPLRKPHLKPNARSHAAAPNASTPECLTFRSLGLRN